MDNATLATSAMADPPAVTVLIAVHNGLPYVESALRSIMAQSLRDIEILVVDDASTDATPEILRALAAEDPRIRIETLTENRRLPGALNRGLELARGTYVARMDADDLAVPERLAVQKAYLDAHPDIVMAGASVTRMGPDGTPLRSTHRPRDKFQTRWLARFYMPLTHPTFMFRRELPDGAAMRYDPVYSASEDYDFTVRMQEHGGVVSLPEMLLYYRVHPGSVTMTKFTIQREQANDIAMRVQRADLPADVVAALSDVNKGYLERRRCDPAGVFRGLRRMLAHDCRRYPHYRKWLWRQSAQIALMTLQTGNGAGKKDIALAFLRHAPDFLPSMAMRGLELSGRAGLRMHPA